MPSPLEALIERVRDGLRAGRYTNEAMVSQGVVLPTLSALGWDVFDMGIVVPEFAVEGRRVDYALCFRQTPRVFVEVKRVGNAADSAEKQLLEYAFLRGVSLAVLTDGQEWSFYLPAGEGSYQERRFYKLDLLERAVPESVERLQKYLTAARVESGDAIRDAQSDLMDVSRQRIILETMTRAWQALITERDELLLEMLADKVEDLCGYKPSLDLCSNYFATLPSRPPVTLQQVAPRTPQSTAAQPLAAPLTGRVGYEAFGVWHPLPYANQVMVSVIRDLAQKDQEFLDRFIARRHGRRRRYVARDKYELYPGRTDLCEEFSQEFIPGWWIGTNYSRDNIKDIIALACEVAGVTFGRDIRVELG